MAKKVPTKKLVWEVGYICLKVLTSLIPINQFFGWDFFAATCCKRALVGICSYGIKVRRMFIQLSKVLPNAAVQFDQSGEKD